MRVLVTGGRGYANEAHVCAVLDLLLAQCGPMTLIQGGATGADQLARFWSIGKPNVDLINEPADWAKHGKRAEHIRNQRMLDTWKPDVVIAFDGGAGTRDMIRRADLAGIPVRRV